MLRLIMLLIPAIFISIYGSADDQNQTDGLPEMEKKEIELRKQLREQHLKEMNEQVESQSKFISDWPKYSQDVEQIKMMEEKTRELEKQLQELEERKAALIKKQDQKFN
jgi:hypothetical protein